MVLGQAKTRSNRHDNLNLKQFKPLDLLQDFDPSMTCREYVEKDCAEALPLFRPHCEDVITFCEQVCCPASLFCFWAIATSCFLPPATSGFLRCFAELLMTRKLDSCSKSKYGACYLQWISKNITQDKACGLDEQQVFALVR
jgi:hypothetical protein